MNDSKSQSPSGVLVNIKSFENSGDLQIVNGYGDNAFRISGERYVGPVIILPRFTISWKPPVNANELEINHILSYLGDVPPPLFVLGVGEAPKKPLDDLSTGLKAEGISLELMSTAAASRTWNVLMSEGRDAATGLYPIS